MGKIVSRSFLLLAFSVVLCCVVYVAALLILGQTLFPFEANGSMINGPDGKLVGSKLIAQPFTRDEYFQARPSAASYDASASASSSYSANNYTLRDRVARSIGPIVNYKSGPNAGKPVAPDVEAWFKKDVFQGNPHIVSQWADTHNSLAQAWVSADPTHATYIDEWAKAHQAVVTQFIKDNPATPQPKAADLAVEFFKNFSSEHPAKFPADVTHTGADNKTTTVIEPVDTGSDIQSVFFDMWRQDHPDDDMQDIPGDLVTASASGLDPHITLVNAEFQLDRVASKWADNLKRDNAGVREEIDAILKKSAFAPLAGGTDAYTGNKYSAFHDGMVMVGVTIPIVKDLTIQPVAMYTFPLSHDASRIVNGVSYNPNGALDQNFVYGLNLTYNF
ncbi:potassium-transporting ATPase subunit C [Candidatus Magnetominusculus dajiuhuensis]|uniref:potassium-transporting ATPase subunit C n=1 Tax=Candidatus Magnetominusculus dajiuhuensis TaxID=3137712 RepID=UPI003B42913C